ncbi:LexA family protein [Streptomyces sp. NPDC050535]|uniref:LexA family protein n=1 Tax=Streptomyces sp. NPDC050535 TaxID=3365626 RepID=UPI0037A4E837
MSPRQQRIIVFIQEATGRHGYPPSLREIGEAVGPISTPGVRHHTQILERLGVLKRLPGSLRYYEVVVGYQRPAADESEPAWVP